MKYNVSNADRLGDCAWIVGFFDSLGKTLLR